MVTTTQNPVARPTKANAPPKTVAQRVTEQIKAAALRGKITSDELDAVAALAGALKTFIKA